MNLLHHFYSTIGVRPLQTPSETFFPELSLFLDNPKRAIKTALKCAWIPQLN